MKMQLCNVEVLLAGDRNQTVVKSGVSVAEIVVLEAIHGQGSVTNIDPYKQEDRDPRAELFRLRKLYAPNAMTERGRVVERLFPGHRPELPAMLEDIGRDDEGRPVEIDENTGQPKTRAPKKKKAAKKKAAKKAESDTGDTGDDDPLE